MNRQLEWYRYLVHNNNIPGSLFTLIHLPFMLAFLSLVVIGAAVFQAVDRTVLVLSLAVVFLLLYGEHMLDDTTWAGKPWKTAFGDITLAVAGVCLFALALLIGIYASNALGSLFPGIAVGTGVLFCALYSLELWNFHTVEFGALGMAIVPVSSYLIQALAANQGANPAIVISLGIFGFGYGYVMLALYEHTKTQEYKIAWRLLGLHFVLIYALVSALSAERVLVG